MEKLGVTIKYLKLTDPAFIKAIQKIAKADGLEPDVAVRAGQLWAVVKRQIIRLGQFQIQMHEKWGEKDAHGNLLYRDEMKPNLHPRFKTKMDYDACAKECDEFAENKFIVSMLALPFKSMTMLSGEDWIALEGTDIVEGIPGQS